jgi:DNA-binding MarR family transcriptional regulator/N-acetylglutamate synthase-like GNAT family acetyltransferase
LSVGEAADVLGVSQPAVTRTHAALKAMGFTRNAPGREDQRKSLLSLTPEGARRVERMQRELWPAVRAAARDLCGGPDADFLKQVDRLEAALAERSLDRRIRALTDRRHGAGLFLVEYEDSLAGDFERITRSWVEDMFTLEENDLRIIQHPRETIVDRGGEILFVASPELGIVGTCALMPADGGRFELTKMGVVAEARGLRAGHFLMEQILRRARRLQATELFLLTNAKCEAAIHLYEKYGFVRDDEILRNFGARYSRCDIAMSYPQESLASGAGIAAAPRASR